MEIDDFLKKPKLHKKAPNFVNKKKCNGPRISINYAKLAQNVNNNVNKECEIVHVA